MLLLELWNQHKSHVSSVSPIQVFQVPPTDLLSITLEIDMNYSTESESSMYMYLVLTHSFLFWLAQPFQTVFIKCGGSDMK